MTLALIWAESEDGVIGADGTMPWHLPEDLAHFRDLTNGDPVIMGRRTWDSLPERFRPLPGRTNIVVTRQSSWAADGATACSTLESALVTAGSGSERRGDAVSWVIGGAELFRASIELADRLEVTEIRAAIEGDTFAPPVDGAWRVVSAEPANGWLRSTSGLEYRFVRYERATTGTTLPRG